MPRKLTQIEVSEIYAKEGYTLIGIYKNSVTKVETICPQGHSYLSLLGNFINRKNRCIHCDSLKTAERQKTPYENVVKAAEILDLELVMSKEEYAAHRGTKKIGRQGAKLPLKCKFGHNFRMSLCYLKKAKIGCNKCAWKSLASKKVKSQLEIDENLKLLGYKSDSIYVNNKIKMELSCSKDHKFTMSWNDLSAGHGCPVCNGRNSKKEIEILEWVQGLGFDAKACTFRSLGIDNSLREIDVYIPKLKLGIEFNGLRWHSEKILKDKNKHVDKFKACKKAGIDLLTIFEHEWDKRKIQVKGLISSKLGIYNRTVWARKCLIKDLDADIAKEFLGNYHIQGPVRADVYIGLINENEIIAVAALGKHHRQGHEKEAVLSRVCFKSGVKVAGGTGKLTSECIRRSKALGLDKLVSWSDNRVSSGKSYLASGWLLKKELSPDYFYYNTISHMVQPKQSCKKKDLAKKMTKNNIAIKNQMKEHEMAAELGLYRVWDCGKIKWEINVA
jgi:hypothetical protein